MHFIGQKVFWQLLFSCFFVCQAAVFAEEGFVAASKTDKKIVFARFSSSSIYSEPSGLWWLSPSTHYDNTVPLTLVQVEGSDWTRDDILDEVRTAEEIFAQCKLSFAPILLISIGVDYAQDDMGGDVAEAPKDVMADIALLDLEFVNELEIARPLAVFRQVLSSYAYAEVTFEGVDRQFLPLSGTAFITTDTRRSWGDNTSTAHELAHLMANERHNLDPDNLLCGDEGWDMYEACGTNTALTAEQCERVDSWVANRAPDYEDLIYRPE
jgi:hypothetical protein